MILGTQNAYAYTSMGGQIGRFFSYTADYTNPLEQAIWGSAEYQIVDGPSQWQIKNQDLAVAEKTYQFPFGSFPGYQFDAYNAPVGSGIYGGHDLMGQDVAEQILAHVKSTNQANWAWIQYLIQSPAYRNEPR
ncbi:MAG: hypothetical protein K6T83_02200 [Alicyclobacillus sp.]|nr:hypothetical protein [Alicyclobacillus sp.]